MIIRALVISIFFLGGVLPASAQFQLNGDADQLSCKCYRLTNDSNNEAGSVWNTTQIDLTNPFDKTFEVFLGCDDAGADGIAFVLQPISTTVGGGGGGLGYQGVSPSFAAEFDTYENGWDPADDHIAIQQDGNVDHSSADNLAGPVSADPGGANIEDCGYHTVRVTWDPASNVFEVYFDGNLRLSYTGDIVNNIFGGNPNVYWGFTGSTGGEDNDQRFCISVISNFTIGDPAACLSDSVSFVDSSYSTVGQITDWNWAFGDGTSSTDSMPEHKYSSPGTYNVKLIVTSSNTCKDTVTKPVEVHAGPTADFAADTVCFGDTIAFTDQSTPGDTTIIGHGWFFGDGTTSTQTNPDHSYSSPGTYNMGLIVQDANGCEDTSTRSLYQPPALSVSVVDTTHVTCYDSANGSAVAEASGGTPPYSYSWNSSPVQNDSTATGLDAGTYVVEVTDQEGCIAKDTVTITEPPELVINTFNVDSATCHGLCDGEVSAFPSGGTVSGQYKFYWSGGIGGINEAQPDSVCAGAYSLTIEDDNGCQVDTSFSVEEPPPYYVETAHDSSFCSKPNGAAIVDSVSGNTPGYSYQWDANAGNQTDDTASGLTPGSYNVTISDAQGCDTVVSVSVPNIPGQTVSIDSSSDVSCFGGSDGSATAQVSGGTAPYSYQWNDPASQTGSTATGLQAGTYQVMVTDSAGCRDTATVTIGEPSPVQVSTSPSSDTTICIGGSATLSASASGGTPGYTYHWDNGLGTGQTHTVSPGSNTNYQVYAEDSNGCQSPSANVTVQLYPSLSVTAFSDDSICPGTSTSISAIGSGGSGQGYSYSWSHGPTGSSVTVAPNSTTTYTVTLDDNCETPPVQDSVEIYLNSLPDVSFSGQNLEGCRPLEATFVNTTPDSMVGTQCIWDLGNGDRVGACDSVTATYTDVGCHDVTLSVRTPEGCIDSTTVPNMACVRPYPNPEFQHEPKAPSVQDPEISFTNLSTGASTYLWDFGGLDSSQAVHPSYSFPNEGAGSYQVCLSATNTYGCTDSVCHDVRIKGDFVLYVPNAFSPDGDGVNDRFAPVVQGADPSSYRFIIYDRWGEVVFKTRDPEAAWDGSVKGSAQAGRTDVYVWRLVTKNKYTGATIERQGHVTLIE